MTKIRIENFSYAAFDILLRYIYSGNEALVSDLKELDLLLEVYSLGDMYLLPGLKTLVESAVKGFPFAIHNYAAVFRTVDKYRELVHTESMCKDLQQRCAVAVMKSWKTPEDCRRFWSADHDDDVSLKLALIQQIPPFCSVCSSPQADCLDGQQLTHANCGIGLAVRAKVQLSTVDGHIIPVGSVGKVLAHYENLTPMHSVYNSYRYNGVLSVEWPVTRVGIHTNLDNIVIQCNNTV